MTIWDRYIFKEFTRCFLFFIASFYFLYILIDYAGHPDRFYFDNTFHASLFLKYYFCELMFRFSTIAPFALLISCIKVVCQLVVNHEILAMMASGVKTGKLLRPIFAVALLTVCFLYLNFEYITPPALITLNRLNEAHRQEDLRPTMHQIALKDGSTLLFKRCDSAREQLADVYWIRSLEEIYHMKTISYQSKLPVGSFVDRFRRTPQGELVRVESSKQQTFLNLRLTKSRISEIITPPEEQAISKLWKKLPKEKHVYNDTEAQVLASLYNKLALPWACLLAVIGPIPFCLNFTRKLPVFLIYAASIFGLVAFVILLHSSHILAKRQVLDPFLVTWIPFFTIFSYFSFRYFKAQNGSV